MEPEWDELGVKFKAASQMSLLTKIATILPFQVLPQKLETANDQDMAVLGGYFKDRGLMCRGHAQWMTAAWWLIVVSSQQSAVNSQQSAEWPLGRSEEW